MDELLRIFDLYDVARTGALPRHEIVNVIRSAGVHLSAKDADAYLLFDTPAAAAPSPAAAPPKSGGGKAGAAAAPQQPPPQQRTDISNQLMTREAFQRFVSEKDMHSRVITAAMAASGARLKPQTDLLAALQAFDYREHGYLTPPEVASILTTMNEKIAPEDVAVALRGALWYDGDGTTAASKIRLEDLARHLTQHYSSVAITNDEVLAVVK